MAVENVIRLLSRVTSTGFYIPEIDGLRFFAIFFVVIYHINGYCVEKILHAKVMPEDSLLFNTLSKGWFGVELFFVISGFVLSIPFATPILSKQGKKPNLKAYYLRRLRRLEPPYIINLVLFTALLIVINDVSLKTILPNLFLSIVYLHSIFYGEGSLVNSIVWSLEVEVQFYLLAPLVAKIYYINNQWIRTIAFIVLPLIVRIGADGLGVLSRQNITGNLQYFTAGFILSEIWLVASRKKQPASRFYDVICVFGCAIILFLLLKYNYTGDIQQRLPAISFITTIVLPLLVLVVYSCVFRGLIVNKILRNRWIIVIGGMCYTLYLYHYLIISFIGRLDSKVLAQSAQYWSIFLFQLAIMLPAILIVSAILFIFFEKPFMSKSGFLNQLTAIWGDAKNIF